jgi:hypothetical protein
MKQSINMKKKLCKFPASGRRKRSVVTGEMVDDDDTDESLYKNGLRFNDMLRYVGDYFGNHSDVTQFKLY